MGLPWSAEKIELPQAWDISTGSPTIRVGIIDGGADASHPDLENRVNRELSKSFVSGLSPLEDPSGHGTHIAGIIAAQGNNSIGTAGICWNVEIVSLRIYENGTDILGSGIFVDRITEAIKYATQNDIHILNISIGISDSYYKEQLQTAIADYCGLVVCSAGNSINENDIRLNNDLYAHLPSNLRMDNLISVGASTHIDTRASFSHFGATNVDIFAPGYSILSCYPIALCEEADCAVETHLGIGYHLKSGTSMAAPHVAGVAALLLSAHPELTAAELKQIIMESVDIIYDASGNNVFGNLCVSGGRLNAYNALSTPSIHDFGLWTDYNSTYHARTCTTCGYVQYNHHVTLGTELCGICGHSGPITASIDNPVTILSDSITDPELKNCA